MSSTEREAVLQEACLDNPALLAELQSLLAANDAEIDAAKRFSSNMSISPRESTPHRSIGPYEIDRLLGTGGMGTVYLAHRADGQYEQQVALKLIHRSLNSEVLRNQFRRERQILAGLSHPFIARLLDGGITEQNELYLVMEYIEGESVVTYLRKVNASLRARLFLFENVCKAVQYAHQNLVVHRDIKPDNILVVSDGTPRLLDFGTSKLTSPNDPTGSGELTLHGLRSFTPQYASPEQILGRPISTASDIYSLGVILYVLLADTPPYTLRDASMEAIIYAVCTQDPPKPSAVSGLTEEIDADLDSIALKALRKEPAERYQTVEQFVVDIRAWLEQRPVSARRDTFRYRAAKFARRNKILIGAGVLLASVLLLGILGILWQSHNANAQRMRAEASAAEMRELSTTFLYEIDNAVRDLPGAIPIRRLMVDRVLQHLDSLAQRTGQDKANRIYLADAYVHLGMLQGDPYESNVGDSQGALQSLGKASSLVLPLRSRYPDDRDVLDIWIKTLISRGRILYGAGRAPEAITCIQPALAALDQEVSVKSVSASKLAEAASAYGLLGDISGEPETPNLGDYSGAEAAYTRVRELYTLALARDPELIRAKKGLALSPLQIADVVMLTDPVRSIELIRESQLLWDKIPDKDKSNVQDRRTILYDTLKLAEAYRLIREYKLSIATYETAKATIETRADLDPNDSRGQADYAGVLDGEVETYMDSLNPILNERRTSADASRAYALTELSIAKNDKIAKIDPGNHTWAMYLAFENFERGVLAHMVKEEGGLDAARKSLAQLRQIASENDFDQDVLLHEVSAELTAFPLNISSPNEALRFSQRLVDLTHRKDPNSLELLARAYVAKGEMSAARSVAEEGLALLPRADSETSRCSRFLRHDLRGASAATSPTSHSGY